MPHYSILEADWNDFELQLNNKNIFRNSGQIKYYNNSCNYEAGDNSKTNIFTIINNFESNHHNKLLLVMIYSIDIEKIVQTFKKKKVGSCGNLNLPLGFAQMNVTARDEETKQRHFQACGMFYNC
jgi:hypothetical protein